MPSVDLPAGTIRYHGAGPADAPRPVVFVHGVLTNGALWGPLAECLAAAGVRSYAPDWPLGAHTIAMRPGADQSPRGIARTVLAFLEALELTDVTLVGNDTGGAVCQFVLDTDASRIGRLVLTNCDGFEVFPPRPFDVLLKLWRSPGRIRASLLPTRLTAVRHSVLGFGLLANDFDAAMTRRWVEPALTDAGVRRDLAALCRAIDPRELDGVSRRLNAFPGPALVVWGAADRAFKPALGRRLAATLRDVHHVEVPGAKTFVMLDATDRVCAEMLDRF